MWDNEKYLQYTNFLSCHGLIPNNPIITLLHYTCNFRLKILMFVKNAKGMHLYIRQVYIWRLIPRIKYLYCQKEGFISGELYPGGLYPGRLIPWGLIRGGFNMGFYGINNLSIIYFSLIFLFPHLTFLSF